MYKIFEIIHGNDEREWCTGSTNIEALINYVLQTECDFYEMDDAEIIELPKEKWKEYTVTDEESGDMTFEEWMEVNGNTLDIIAGTMYDL